MASSRTAPRPALAGLLAALALPACPRRAPFDAEPDDDATVAEDASEEAEADAEPRRVDRDGDGLCDSTELGYGTDPDAPDTDRDGLLDSFELDSFSSPLAAADPPTEGRVTLREDPGGGAQAFMTFAYRGVGESLTGLMLDRANGVDGRVANDLVRSFEALTAEPRGAVADLLGPRFTAVDGLVRLRWGVSLAWPSSAAPLGCRRAYLGVVAAVAEGRGIVFSRPLTIDVMAAAGAGTTLDAGAPDASADDAPSGGAWPFVAGGLCLPTPGDCR